jgi:N-acetylneuraminic acid mutarotase
VEPGVISRLSGAPAPPKRLAAWTPLPDAPFNRYESTVAVLGGQVYYFGGFRNASIQASPEVWVFDPERRIWSRKGDLPALLTHVNAAMLGDTVWLAGGFVGDNPGPATDQVWRYEWRHDRWTPGPPLPARRGSGALVALRGRLHYFGGYGEDRHQSRGEHWVLDRSGPDTMGTWVPAAPLPKPRGHLAGAVLGDRIYALGGTDRHDPDPLDVPWVHRYDDSSGVWTEVAPLPTPRSHFEQSTLVRDGRLVVLGGRDLPGGRESLSDVTEYDPVADRWLALPPMPRSLHSPSAALIGDLVYVGLGGSRAGNPDNREMWSERTDALPWQPVAPPPAALGEVSAAAIGNRLYVLGEGGLGTLGLDLGSGRWDLPDRLATRPAPGNHHAAEVWEGKLYLFGGLDAGEGMVQIFDPAQNRWAFGPPLPSAAGSIASALIGSQIYLAGGIGDHGTSDSAYRFDPAAGTFTPIAPMPRPRNHTAAATDGRRFFLFGGRGPGSGDHNQVANGFDDVQIYDPATNTWQISGEGQAAPAPLPQARGGMGKAVWDGREFWVFGGETLDGPGADRHGVYDRVDIYDPAANRWRSGPPMPAARHGVFPVLVGNRIVLVGGGTRAGKSSSTIADALDLRHAERRSLP